jgi:uncharacterized membrane protein
MTNGSDMFDMVRREGWRNAISRRMRQRDIQRQILFNRVRKTSVRSYIENYVPDGIGILLPEFLKTLVGSILGFWIITSLVAYFFRAKPLYTLAAFGLFYSLQATYYKYRLSVDPGYKIPKCRCAGRGTDNTETVLRSNESAILKIPNSAVSTVIYPALFLLVYAEHPAAAIFVAVLAVLASAYLAYVMIVRIAGLCSNCINISALNVLILCQFLR